MEQLDERPASRSPGASPSARTETGMLGIAGPPGSGKTTLAERVVASVPGAVLVGMDGFHLAHATLEALGRVERKGAPDTFDADGYVALLLRIRGLRPRRRAGLGSRLRPEPRGRDRRPPSWSRPPPRSSSPRATTSCWRTAPGVRWRSCSTPAGTSTSTTTCGGPGSRHGTSATAAAPTRPGTGPGAATSGTPSWSLPAETRLGGRAPRLSRLSARRRVEQRPRARASGADEVLP